MIADHPTPKISSGGVAYTFSARDFKGVMIVALADIGTGSKDEDSSCDSD